jgi:hypothetical protein
VVVLQQGEAALARIAQATQPNGTPQLGEVHPVRRPLLSANPNHTPAALSPLRRQNPREEPGALAAHAGIGAGARRNPRPYRDHHECRQIDHIGHSPDALKPAELELLSGTRWRLMIMPSALKQLKRMA